MKLREIKSEKARESAYKRWGKDANALDSGMRTHSDSNAIKERKGNKKKRVDDFTTLKKGDEIRVVGGSGPYYTRENGEKLYLTDRGKYIVKNVDENGIHTHGKHGYDYLYMGKKCPSEILDSITKAPHKIILIRSESHPNHVSPKRTRW